MAADRNPDVIVVGAGSAGCVLAGRLSEDPDCHVLLLETGPSTPTIDASQLARRTSGGRPKTYLRGRGVGGASAVNALVAMPGEPDDYDAWARDFGLPAWSWRDVAPWFERVLVPRRLPAPGEIGPLSAALLTAMDTAQRAPLAADEHGLPVSTAHTYLSNRRANLEVRVSSEVAHVVFIDDRAAGVQLVDGTVVEGGCVVLAAGAIQSPGILLRSGLRRRGIGANLHDHPSLPFSIELSQPAGHDVAWVGAIASLSSTTASSDLQLLALERSGVNQPDTGVLFAALMHVRSRGRVTLRGDLVDVSFDMLSDDADASAMQAAIAAAQRTLDHPAFRRVGRSLDDAPVTEERIRLALGDYVHAAGTCRMGTTDDPMAVVDQHCRVIGVRRLLVADASVIPALPRAGTHLPTAMIAERVASWLGASLRSA